METRNNNLGSLIPGIVLIVLGLVFFAATQGAFNLNWGTIWPAFIMIGGAAVLLQAFLTPDPRRRAGLVLGGTIPLLIGAFFFATTTGLLDWSAQGTLWPIYPLIVGVAFFAAYLTSGLTQTGYVVPGAILTLVGLVFLGVALVGSYDIMGKIWPIFLILAGVLVLVAPQARRLNR